MSNHDPASFAEVTRTMRFLGFGTLPGSGFMHIDLGSIRRWGEPCAYRTTPFLAEVIPAPEILVESRTLKGGGAAGIATVGTAGSAVYTQSDDWRRGQR